MRPSVAVIALARSIGRQNNVVKAAGFLTPENCTVYFVEAFYAIVFLFKPICKLSLTMLTVTACAAVTAEFVIYLPCDNVRIFTVTLRKLLNYYFAPFNIVRVV